MRKKDFNYYSGKKYDGMLGRCYRENDISYKHYGGRGIKVCKDWLENINEFRSWLIKHLSEMGVTVNEFMDKPKSFQLDRIDVNGHYTPDNCRLVTPQQNARNRQASLRKKVISAEGTIVFISLILLLASGCGQEQSYLASSSCTVNQGEGYAQVNCSDGTTATIKDGQIGQTGAQGSTGIGQVGPQGNQGLPGNDGLPGTQITSVQLCSSSVATYPSTFPEVALCIAGRLYGVYSEHGGFLVYMPDGNYYSNGINSSCNFHVTGCVVTP